MAEVSAPGVEDLRAAGLPGVRQLVAAAVRMEGRLDVWPVEVGGHLAIYARIICPCRSTQIFQLTSAQGSKIRPTDISVKVRSCSQKPVLLIVSTAMPP